MKTLTKVKLINWHTFSNEEFEIYKNALITGENGTGKSTILDAIQYVLTAGKCKFNKAASDIGNRTLESYIRCKTGIEGHEFVRSGDVTTYIALEFYDEKTEKYQIIGTVIDLPAGGRLNRDFFQIIDCKISDVAFIEERRVLTRKEFKKALIDHQQTGIFKDTIKEGESLFGNALGVKSKYFDLVTRALAFKAIDNVYQFIVDFLLKEDFVDIQNLRDSIKHYKVLEEKLKISKKECESLAPEESNREMRRNAEISNRVTIIGKVCTPPTLFITDKGQRIANYQLDVMRKYRIKEDQETNKHDFPFVKSYGVVADNDVLAIQEGGMVFVDGAIQTREYLKNHQCPTCGETYQYKDTATEIVPYSTEYLTGCKTISLNIPVPRISC